MHANHQACPPDLKTGEQPEFDIALAIIVPPLVPNLLVYPPGNLAGVIMLNRMIEAGFRERGLVFAGSCTGSELNNALGIYGVANRLEGLKTVQDCLAKCCLLGFAHIAWLDTAEAIWRPWHPQVPIMDFNALLNPSVVEALHREVDMRLALIKIAQQPNPLP